MTKVTYGHAIKPTIPALQYYFDQIQPNALSNFGPVGAQLVEKLRDYLQLSPDKDIVLVSSGHTALMGAYAIAGAKKLLMPNYTFESTRVAATLQGMQVELADVQLHDGCLSVDSILKSDADTVVAVCALSTIPDLAGIEQACKDTGKKLIVDGAASFGTAGIYNTGNMFALSFHGTKTFPLGEGAALIASKQDCEYIRQYIMFGFDANRNPVRLGLNAKLSEYSAAIGMAIWDPVQEEIKKKLAFAEKIKKALPETAVLATTVRDTVYQAVPVVMNSAEASDMAIAKLASLGIESKKYYKPLSSMPVTDMLYSHSVCIPCHAAAAEEADTILEVLTEAFK